MNNLSNLDMYGRDHEARVLQKILLLKNWFEEFNSKQIGEPDLQKLVIDLMKEEMVAYKNKDVFFTQHHADVLKPNLATLKDEQKIFNANIEDFLMKYDLSWEYYLAYKKS